MEERTVVFFAVHFAVSDRNKDLGAEFGESGVVSPCRGP